MTRRSPLGRCKARSEKRATFGVGYAVLSNLIARQRGGVRGDLKGISRGSHADLYKSKDAVCSADGRRCGWLDENGAKLLPPRIRSAAPRHRYDALGMHHGRLRSAREVGCSPGNAPGGLWRACRWCLAEGPLKDDFAVLVPAGSNTGAPSRLRHREAALRTSCGREESVGQGPDRLDHFASGGAP